MSAEQEFPAELVEIAALGIARFRTSPPEYATADSWDRKLALAALRALRDAGALVGPDQVAVPREATPEMIKAGRVRPYREDDSDAENMDLNTALTWDAMLAAAPRAGGGDE